MLSLLDLVRPLCYCRDTRWVKYCSGLPIEYNYGVDDYSLKFKLTLFKDKILLENYGTDRKLYQIEGTYEIDIDKIESLVVTYETCYETKKKQLGFWEEVNFTSRYGETALYLEKQKLPDEEVKYYVYYANIVYRNKPELVQQGEEEFKTIVVSSEGRNDDSIRTLQKEFNILKPARAKPVAKSYFKILTEKEERPKKINKITKL